jgi:large subunit ribosomal protein L19e
MASDILKAGESRIWIDPMQVDEVQKAITKDDVRNYIRKGLVKAKPKQGVSRIRGKMNAERKRKGRSSGFGKRKGTSKARLDPKIIWMARIRSQRKLLKSLKDEGAVKEGYRHSYQKIKGGAIRDKAHLITFLKERKYLKENYIKK